MGERLPVIFISKLDSLSDEKISISVTGLEENKVYSLYSTATLDTGSLFESLVHYQSDHTGCIDLDTHQAISGSYAGVEPMGIFWSMKCSRKNQNLYARFVKLDVTTPLVVSLDIYESFIESTEEIDNLKKSEKLQELKIASASMNRWYMAPGIRRIEFTVEKDGMHGILFVPPGSGPFPAVITMFGSFPGTMEYKASLLASHGFAALALAFIGAPGLPNIFTDGSSLELEYFEKVVNLLLARKEIDAQCGVGVMVLSFTGFIGLAMANFLPSVKCVISCNGITHSTLCSLTYRDRSFLLKHDQDLGSVSGFLSANSSETPAFQSRAYFPVFKESYQMRAPLPEDQEIDFYNQHGVGYMFIASLLDKNVPSEHYANRCERLLQLSGHPNYSILRYPGAGHLIDPPYIPHNEISSTYGLLMDWGGKTVPHCKAQEDAWRRQIEFLRANLISCPISKL